MDPDPDPQHWCQEKNARGLLGPIFYLDFKVTPSSLFTIPSKVFKSLGAGIVGEYGGMEKEKKEKENCVKKEMHVGPLLPDGRILGRWIQKWPSKLLAA
jgi:hypothetical protein